MSCDEILIVDDNPDDIEITKTVMVEMGRGERIAAASRGELALKFLRQGQTLPVLILLDLKMPGMSGIDTLREIRTDERLRRIPVIVVTSSTLESDRENAYATGADSFLHKSVNIDEFGRALDGLLRHYLKNC
jgi:two-component system response regulator